jgi:hypothetical protein
VEGIWYAHFTSGPTQGDGLAVLRSGEILGGDASHTYKGSYQQDGVNLYVNVQVAPYIGSKIPADIDHPVSLFLTGSVQGDLAKVSGHVDNHQDVTVSVELRKGA